MITAITVNGAALDLTGVEYRVTVSHGRNDITSTPAASDASLSLFGFATIPVEVSDLVVIEAYSVTRFTGRVSDVLLTHDYNPVGPINFVGRLDVTLIGNLALLGLAFVGDSGYPRELLTDRVDNILTDAGVTFANNSDPLMTQEALHAQAGGYAALDLLTALCTETGATLADLPDGNVLFESYSRRGYGYNPAHWFDLDPTDTWPDIPFIWADVYDRVDAAPLTVAIPQQSTAWAPTWRSTNQTILNDVTVVYGSAGNQDKNDTDPASIAVHGRRAFTLTTKLHKATDAQTRASEIVRAQSEPRYAMANVQVLMETLTEPTLSDVLDLISGSRVNLDNTPQPSPIEDYTGVVEGWSETYTPGQHTLTLSLSDPRFSYLMVKWNEISPTLVWSAVDPTVQWYNVVLASDLVA
ncbi:hypothetical protein UFOVP1504_18 [uncultured Caudovirales phage]|uniref:Uncharacterized protein n=1 Tax=uncultured Caudovirales phage TaxID=2100421 RepID=A0A6J5SPL1_9CAUD|nr:hypothetical protein UFOVP1143_24 [uncultured Caudovirales phage]CAB4217185.1 hypothetical protein UFOVP1504_18 [uncultured Caudovirales phage]